MAVYSIEVFSFFSSPPSERYHLRPALGWRHGSGPCHLPFPPPRVHDSERDQNLSLCSRRARAQQLSCSCAASPLHLPPQAPGAPPSCAIRRRSAGSTSFPLLCSGRESGRALARGPPGRCTSTADGRGSCDYWTLQPGHRRGGSHPQSPRTGLPGTHLRRRKYMEGGHVFFPGRRTMGCYCG